MGPVASGQIALNDALGQELEQHRVELTGLAYRMLGSVFEAEDAVQDALVRAWRSWQSFDRRSSVRTWLYRITTNVCLDALKGRQRRARPVDLGPARSANGPLGGPRPEEVWLEPMPDGRAIEDLDPADRIVQRETIRLAFVAALHSLPPRQRAVLILRDVLRFSAEETAEMLDSSPASVNSALQRARATMEANQVAETEILDELDPDQTALLARYVEAFEAYDLDRLTELLHEEVVQTMPPYDLWLQGHADIRAWYLGTGIGCKDSRLVPTAANGSPAFGQYRPAPDGSGFVPWALQVIEISDGRITGLNAFLETARFFPLFGLPARLAPDGTPAVLDWDDPSIDRSLHGPATV